MTPPFEKGGTVHELLAYLLAGRYDADQRIDAAVQCVGNRTQLGFSREIAGFELVNPRQAVERWRWAPIKIGGPLTAMG
jgi:CRISPR type IV-associated protein Csf3